MAASSAWKESGSPLSLRSNNLQLIPVCECRISHRSVAYVVGMLTFRPVLLNPEVAPSATEANENTLAGQRGGRGGPTLKDEPRSWSSTRGEVLGASLGEQRGSHGGQPFNMEHVGGVSARLRRVCPDLSRATAGKSRSWQYLRFTSALWTCPSLSSGTLAARGLRFRQPMLASCS